jgi:hypothetical protein
MRNLKLSVCFFLFLIGTTQAQERPTHEIHAAMVFNFIKYIQWPDEGDAGEFVVGVLGDDKVFDTLQKWYDGKPKGNKKYVIKKLSAATESSGCQVVYVGKSKSRDFDSIKENTSGKSILTVTDGNGLGQKGSCINFKVVDGKLKFELNQGTVAGSNLKISSQLSSMAILL